MFDGGFLNWQELLNICLETEMTTKKIAEFCAETRYSDIPQEAVLAAKRGILDFLGVSSAGSREPAAKKIAKYAKHIGAVREASVFGAKFQTSADLAAWVNGTTSHALDYDDTFSNVVRYNIHPSVPILPAVLALGETLRASGRDILAAYLVGLEVEYRLGAAIGQRLAVVGWHSTPILGTIAATGASANLLRLNTSQTQMALGIAGSLASGINWNVGTMTKPMHAGNASRNGVLSALLAKDGFTGNDSILEGEFGFCSIFSGEKVEALIDSDLGITWNTVSLGLAFKPYPSCRSTHGSIDAALHIKKTANISIDQIAEITCKIGPFHTRVCRFHKPKTGYEGKFSIPYCIATALINGRVMFEDFTDEKVIDAKSHELLSKVKLLNPEGWGSGVVDLTTEILIKLRDGTEHSHKVSLPKGEPGNPLTDDELSSKFRDCASLVLSKQNVEKALDLVWHWEKLENITELMPLFALIRT